MNTRHDLMSSPFKYFQDLMSELNDGPFDQDSERHWRKLEDCLTTINHIAKVPVLMAMLLGVLNLRASNRLALVAPQSVAHLHELFIIAAMERSEIKGPADSACVRLLLDHIAYRNHCKKRRTFGFTNVSLALAKFPNGTKLERIWRRLSASRNLPLIKVKSFPPFVSTCRAEDQSIPFW